MLLPVSRVAVVVQVANGYSVEELDDAGGGLLRPRRVLVFADWPGVGMALIDFFEPSVGPETEVGEEAR